MKSFFLFAALLYCLTCLSQKSPAAPKSGSLARPKLVVGIVIDQMRWDYLYRYYDRYQQGGFRRLLNEGFSCENTYINYLPAVTAIGHSTIYTGSVPAIHGITGNDFIVEATGKTMYCTEDSTANTVGSSSTAGKMSPKNLLSNTITDELRLATNFRSKVIGVALKDRGSILPAGHSANAAYWFDDPSGNWITSTYYMNALPAWLNAFNAQKLPAKYLKQDWAPLYDTSTYVQSSPDDNPYEGKFTGTKSATLPVQTSTMFANNYSIIRTTPSGNTLTTDMAKAIIVNEKLGKSSTTDFLAVSYSSPDYIGHRFGINALETEDSYLRLDRDLASLFTFLDAQTGKGNYTVFLTADHGAAHNPNFLIDHKIPAGYWRSSDLLREVNASLEQTFKFKNLVLSFSNYQVHLNNSLIAREKLPEDEIRKELLRLLMGRPGISFVVDNDKAGGAGIPEQIRMKIQNGYNSKRSGAITIILDPAYYSGPTASATGTSHGSWNAYDTHIPLVWMGWGVKHGTTNRRVYMTDIAATLAAILHIQEPNGSIGEPVYEVIK
ncbi:alkaline phosphatase family protein [Segetibacter sp. 3557_3]|uniref:alkaline phosphatase PafA n=1 Tax=Segetibacter sp. 3557_3 TaxID=2547429 RepID=UPI001058B28E|nr:alkaline phosphatase PafA [Segetibacter sp. 3557_3]TDH27051.1 alkaline phosphatase family protein [Segetibacter sp. 3557_3]